MTKSVVLRLAMLFIFVFVFAATFTFSFDNVLAGEDDCCWMRACPPGTTGGAEYGTYDKTQGGCGHHENPALACEVFCIPE